MIVSLSHHAHERLSQRFNANVNPDIKLDISKHFVLTRQYQHNTTGAWISSWLCTTPGRPCMMIVDEDQALVVTVMNSGPVVDAAYAAFARSKH